MSAMFCCCGSSGRLRIVDIIAVTFVFKTSGFLPFVLLSTLCHESHVIPLLDFRLSSYEPYQKFPTYFVGVFCFNLKYILSHKYIGNFPYISEIYDIFCRLFCFNLECILSYSYLSDKLHCRYKFKEVALQNKPYFSKRHLIVNILLLINEALSLNC